MKNNFIAFVFAVLMSLTGYSQSPQFLNYQGVARDASGNIISTPIGLRFEIWRTSPTGTKVYQEEMSSTPSAAGIFTTAIGSGSNTIMGSFSSINWANGPYFIVVGIDPTGGTSFSTVGTSQLLSVPYALYAETAGNAPTFTAGNGITINSGTITNSAPDKTVGISPSGITNVLGTYPNYTVDVAAPNLNYNGGTQVLTLTQGSAVTTATITGAASGTVSMFASGIASVTPVGPGNNFTVSVQTPSFTGAGSTTVTGTYPNYLISTPTASTVASTSTNIQINPPHSTSTISAGNYSITIQPTNISGPGVIGSYPNYTIGVGAPPIIIGQGVTTVTTAGNNYTVASPPVNMTYAPATGVISYSPAIGTNTLNISPSLTFTNAILTVGSNTVFVPGTGLWSKPTATVTSLTNAADNVGIGTATPSEKLQVETGANSDISIVSTGANRATLNLGTTANHFLGAMSYNGGTNNMDFTSNGIPNRLFFDFSGRTAIGYTTTVSELDVNGSLRLGGSRLFLGAVGGINTGYTGIYETGGGDLRLAVFSGGAPVNPPFAPAGNSIDALAIKLNTGNVGIGINAPSYPLHLQKSAAGIFAASIENTNATGWGLQVRTAGTSNSQNAFEVYTGGVSKFLVREDGYVGIGNLSPTTYLQISGTNPTTVTSAFSSSPETSIRLHNNDLTNNNFSSLIFSSLASNLASFEAAKILGVNSNHTAGSIGGDLVFMTRDPGNIFERMRITSTGSVGIGTSNPSTMLHVVSASPDVANFTSTSATDNRILISNSSGLKGTMGFTTFNNTMQFSSYGNDDLCFGANNLATVIMMLKTSGNVGIGTSAPAAQLEVNQYTKLGSTAPAVQMAKLTGVTATAQGNTANIVIPAFIPPTKILSVTVMVQWNAVGDWIQPGYTINPGYEFDWYTSGNTLFITNKSANSGNILSKAIQVLITYEQ